MSETTQGTDGFKVEVPLEKTFQIPDTDRIVGKVGLNVVRGEGKMSGKSWVRLNFGELSPMDAVGYGFDGNDFIDLTDGTVVDNEITRQVKDFLSVQPEQLSNLLTELNK